MSDEKAEEEVKFLHSKKFAEKFPQRYFALETLVEKLPSKAADPLNSFQLVLLTEETQLDAHAFYSAILEVYFLIEHSKLFLNLREFV